MSVHVDKMPNVPDDLQDSPLRGDEFVIRLADAYDLRFL
jgi:hypothetical protein